ncbi:MAG: alpha/beta fold hydrolase [Anaerolineae bacterium]|nr:alpha/beta fold hydrolase [Anaerolineae bacterium]
MKIRLTFILLIVVTLFSGSSLAQAARPDAPAYAKRGAYLVGTRELRIEDAKRPLDAAIWYPALNPEHKKVEAEYRFLMLAGTGQALRDAPPDPSGGPYPLIVYSHGLGGAKYQSVFYLEQLASYGFVVIAVDHPGSTFGNITMDAIIENIALRPLDVLREIAFAETWNADGGVLAGLIDTDRIGVTGHSFGGYTALSAGGARIDFDALRVWCASNPDPALQPDEPCGLLQYEQQIATIRGLTDIPHGIWPATTDPRIKAIVLHAPWNAVSYQETGLAEVTAPLMVLVGSVDGSILPERDAYPLYDRVHSTIKAQVVFENANHYIFVDECIPALILIGQHRRCSDEVWDMPRAHDLIDHFSTAFFLMTLKGDADAAQAIDPGTVRFVGVDYKAELK